MTKRSPKERLTGQDLLGFVRREGEQVSQRASSAKVTTVKSLAELDKEIASDASRRRSGRSS